jgi:hypothetical protein
VNIGILASVSLSTMTYSKQWLELCKSAEAYRIRQYDALQDKEQLASDLEKALADDSLIALGVWRDLDPGIDILLSLLPQVLSFAIDSSSPDSIHFAQEVLAQHKEDPALRNHLQSLIEGYLVNKDDWNYRRLAELYTHLQYKEELATLLERCRVSDNTHIQEISDDYRLL